MQNILIDGRPLQDYSATRGIGTYLRGLLEGFSELNNDTYKFSLLLNRNSKVPKEIHDYKLSIASRRIPQLKRRLQPIADPFLIAKAVHKIKPNLYHGIEYGQPFNSPCPVVITVHDLIPFIFPKYYPWLRRERILAIKLLKKSTHIIADSAATAKDIERIADVDPRLITVVPLGISPSYAPTTPELVSAGKQKYQLNHKYLLAVGTFDPRKRIDYLAKIIAAIRREHKIELVIVGDQGVYAHNVQAELQRANISDHTKVLGYVPNSDLVALYTGAEALIFTSEYEGFGLPLLEAMACGCPVVAFSNSSLPEVGGKIARLVENHNLQAMESAISQLLLEPSLHMEKSEAGLEWVKNFTWEKAAQLTSQVYKKTLSGR